MICGLGVHTWLVVGGVPILSHAYSCVQVLVFIPLAEQELHPAQAQSSSVSQTACLTSKGNGELELFTTICYCPIPRGLFLLTFTTIFVSDQLKTLIVPPPPVTRSPTSRNPSPLMVNSVSAFVT